ncbi:MAG: hypothetical protein ACJAYA_000623 [Bacteroidia bacterium]|jgi:hypothetical protein
MIVKEPKENIPSKYGWVYFAIFWSTFMILIMGVADPWYNDEAVTVNSITPHLIVWIPLGFLVGLLQRYLAKRAVKKSDE